MPSGNVRPERLYAAHACVVIVKAGRDGDPEIGHLGELAALAAEKVAHDGRAFRLA